jgi:8-oxo-dGTP diphosphatase
MDGGEKHYITIFVFISQFSGNVQLQEPQKCEGWGWFSWDALPTPLFAPIPSYLRHRLKMVRN